MLGCEHAPRPKGSYLVKLLRNTSFALLKSEDRGCAAPGMKPPEVHSELTSHGNNGLLALRPGSSGSFCQDGEPLLHRVISGLKTHHAPCQLDQSGPQPAISMFCDRTRHAFGPGAIVARTEARVTGDLSSVLEALPVADLAANDNAATLKAFSAEEFGLDSYVTTVGANELSYAGNFTNRNDAARLGEIMVPTLLTCGRADVALPRRAPSTRANCPAQG